MILLIDNYETALIIPIFYDYMEICGEKAFVNLLKVKNDLDEFVYTIQILLEINNSMFCFASPVFDVIETNALNSVLNNFVIKQLIDVVIKSGVIFGTVCKALKFVPELPYTYIFFPF